LGHFSLDDLGVGIAFGMVLDEDGKGFLPSVFTDEEPWRFMDEAYECNLESRSNRLKQEWNSPRPIVLDVLSAERNTSCN
jgi:hypothetical protein